MQAKVVGLARNMIFRVENWTKCKEKALQTSLEESYKSAESISIKFANVDFWVKIDEKGKGYPLKNFFGSKNEMAWKL